MTTAPESNTWGSQLGAIFAGETLRTSKTIPPKFRDFYAERYGAWANVVDQPERDIPRLAEAVADYLDLIAAKTIGEGGD